MTAEPAASRVELLEAADRDVIARLRRAEGQLRGIQRMITSSRQCEEVVAQMLAVRAALDRMVEIHLSSNIRDCARGLPPEEAAERMTSLMSMVTRKAGARG
jgi:DNA-binding FrmR family transcriptional regulator